MFLKKPTKRLPGFPEHLIIASFNILRQTYTKLWQVYSQGEGKSWFKDTLKISNDIQSLSHN